MNDFSCTYTVSLSDYRRSFYFGLIQRHLSMFVLAAIVVVVGILYFFASMAGLNDGNAMIYIFAGVFSVYLLINVGCAEWTIQKYQKSKDCCIGKKYSFSIEGKRVEIVSLEDDFHTDAPDLAFVIETNSAFLISVDNTKMYILPTSAIGDSREELEDYFRKQLGERFLSKVTRRK